MRTIAETHFLWQWNTYTPQPDTANNRARAANLLRAWRRLSRNKTSHGRILLSLTRIRPHVYRVTHHGSGEVATMFVVR